MAAQTQSLMPLIIITILLYISPPSIQLPQQMNLLDLTALMSIKNDLTGDRFFSTWNFTSPDPCSSFSGVTCSSSHSVIALTLGSSLTGSLSPSISKLTHLTQLILSPGIITGSIPPQLGLLINLRVISLTNNRLTGPIPISLSTLPHLHTLDLSYNRLTGSIPPALPSIPNLKILILGSNKLTGSLPTVSTQLLHLDVNQNQLTGPLPSSLPSSLRYLSVANNKMWGPIVNGTESLSELVYLDLSVNQFSGTIPASLFNPKLSSMLLQRNNLSGEIPFSSSNFVGPKVEYGQGSIVDLSHNLLTGEVSRVLSGVESLFLNNNHFIGTVPDEYVNSIYMGSTKILYLQHNYFSSFPKLGSKLPDTASLCLSYNCITPPLGLTACPASAGDQLSRPPSQCSGGPHI